MTLLKNSSLNIVKDKLSNCNISKYPSRIHLFTFSNDDSSYYYSFYDYDNINLFDFYKSLDRFSDNIVSYVANLYSYSIKTNVEVGVNLNISRKQYLYYNLSFEKLKALIDKQMDMDRLYIHIPLYIEVTR